MTDERHHLSSRVYREVNQVASSELQAGCVLKRYFQLDVTQQSSRNDKTFPASLQCTSS
jgi:hypothetical protein